MKSIPVQVGGPGLTSGQSPTYYEHNNGLTGIIEPRASPRSIALLYPLCRFMTPRETEKKILPVSLDLDPGDTCSLRDSMRRKNRGERRQPLPLSSFFPLCVSRSPTSSSSSSYRAIDFVLASSGARENSRESIFFFRFDLERNVDSNVDRESLSSCARLYLRASRAEPSSLSSPACHGERERKRACVSRASSTRDISNAVATPTDPPLGSNPVYRRDRIEEDRVFGNLTRSIHGC